MILKDLLLITFGGGGFLGLMGTSGYFVYRQETIKNVERDISKTLGEINTEVQNLIGKRVNDKGIIEDIEKEQNPKEKLSEDEKNKKKEKIENIRKKIKQAEDKNNTSWKYYVDGVSEITKKYTEILEKEETFSKFMEETKAKQANTQSKKVSHAKPAVPKPVAAKPVAVRPPVVAKPVAAKPAA